MHRPGHVDDTGGGTQSMDRRKYLKTLTMGAVATAAGAVLLDSCKQADTQQEQATTQKLAEEASTVPLWGYLSVYEDDVVNIAEARQKPPVKDQLLYRIPFFNNNGIPLGQGSVIGFQLMKIGCPTAFVIATNLVDHDHEEHQTREWLIDRNKTIDSIIEGVGIKKTPWSLPVPC